MTARLERSTDPRLLHSGGSLTYRVFLDDTWVGWIGDGRPWRGWRYGTRRWWAAWRQDGDTAARWNPGLAYRTRHAALTALLTRIAQTNGDSS